MRVTRAGIKPPELQRGAVALVVALVLVFGMTLVAFFANRDVIFEQRTSANQYRATRALEAAEAGLEWALARLNDDIYIAASPACTPGTGSQTFRDRYIAPTSGATPIFQINTANPPRPGCSLAQDGTAAACSCPTSGTDPDLGSSNDDLPRFTVRFNPVTGDPLAVEIISYGCTNKGAPCDPGSTATPDGTAVVRVLLKVRPRFPNAPGAGLIAGHAAVTDGSFEVINLDAESNGITINAGTTVQLGAGTTPGNLSVTTLPGTPPRASVLDNDPTLNALTNADTAGDLFFQSFFGETQAQYRDNPMTWIITEGSCNRDRCTSCSPGDGCGRAVSDAINKGVTQFWADADVQFVNGNLPTSGTVGTKERPISFAGSAGIELRASLTAYGMFFVNKGTADWDYSGSGNGKVFGSFVSRATFDKGGSGNLDLIYDANIFRTGQGTGLLVRVPGSWRDSETAY
jgi:hypothetical protein